MIPDEFLFDSAASRENKYRIENAPISAQKRRASWIKAELIMFNILCSQIITMQKNLNVHNFGKSAFTVNIKIQICFTFDINRKF